jgi:hypothetical protein
MTLKERRKGDKRDSVFTLNPLQRSFHSPTLRREELPCQF